MLRHQRRRLEGDCLTAVLLIKRAEVSPLSWGFLFSLCLETETAGHHTLAVYLFIFNSPRLISEQEFILDRDRRGRSIIVSVAASNARDK